MPSSVISLALMTIFASIPNELLVLAFDPVKHFQTLDERIIQEVIYGRVLPDVNLLTGKPKKIEILSNWRTHTRPSEMAAISGMMYDAAFYRIPPEAREHRQIAAIQNISSSIGNGLPAGGQMIGNSGGTGGNTVAGLASAALNSRTFADYTFMPQVTLQSGNILRIYPDTFIFGLTLDILLEYDEEFTNANQNVKYHLKNLILCATKQYIYNTLLISIDTAEVVGGMTIGAVKDKMLSYEGAESEYNELLLIVRGAGLLDPEVAPALIRFLV